MKDLSIYDTSTQNEAMLNELKGNLFEYLLASKIALHFSLASEFSKNIPADFLERLREYEIYIRKHDEELFGELPNLAHSTFEKIITHLPKNIKSVELVGKLSGKEERDIFGEADILLVHHNDSITPISLKICKSGSFVNTKSGGIKSFFEKYFSTFSNASFYQEKLNSKTETIFNEMLQELYEHNDLAFNGHYDQQWLELGKSELPGKLEEDDSRIVQSFYKGLIKEFYQTFNELFNKDKKLFNLALKSLIGFSDDRLLLITTFYTNNRSQKYMFERVEIKNSTTIDNELAEIEISPFKDGLSSFEIKLPSSQLQIRLKPMNKFTVPALKVNCSIKANIIN